MAPINRNNEPLGLKHKEYNKKLQDAIVNQTPLEDREFIKSSNDLENIMKIDIACHNKDIDYIQSVLKSDDMLYISRAIKQSPWLVDDQYAHIINPTFLNECLFPSMKTKASIKLLKHIRHYLKNESRVEEFCNSETKHQAAAKWLSHCSLSFIECNIIKYIEHITNSEFKRLCERSVTVFEAVMKEKDYYSGDRLKAVSFLLHTHPDKYLDAFENYYFRHISYGHSSFGSTATDLIMKKAPNRIKNNFLNYVNHIHIPTFIRHIDRTEVKHFLLKFANQEVKSEHEFCFRRVFEYSIIKQFVQRMPKEEQFEFVKKVFLDKNLAVLDEGTLQRGTEIFAMKKIFSTTCGIRICPLYIWYEFAPFNIAFDELKNLIQSETNITEKYAMYKFLLKCAVGNMKNSLDMLIYYSKNSFNDDINQKQSFIDNFISGTEIYKHDAETWKAFTDILNSMDIYPKNHTQTYIEMFILHAVLNNEQVTLSIEESFTFNTLKKYRKKLNQVDQKKVFDFIYNYVVNEVQVFRIQTENEFPEAIRKLKRILTVLLDWDKELADFPFALEKIRELIQIRKDNCWNTSLSSLYNKKKSWRRLMFEESIELNPSQNVFVNALKHDPELLSRYKSLVDATCYNDAVSMKRLLKKIRIYWPDSLADAWTKSYLDQLDKVESSKALSRGLCTLLPQNPLLDIIKMYAPAQPKIDWNNTDERTLGLQRCIAKNMHIARPQPSADSVLLYAKGDFLQYALPSLLTIYYDMGRVESQEQIPKLLNAPVSLQKHGLRLAFNKLKHDELKFHLCNVWQASKNITIRAVTFGLLFDLMCKEKDVAKAKELWDILEVFIDNLTFKEDKKIYEKLPKVNDVPESIKPKFLVKSYKFLKSLVPHIKIDRQIYENGIETLAHYTKTIMEFMCPEFVASIIVEYMDANFCNREGPSDSMLQVVSTYLLCAKDEQTQNDKYEKVLAPFLKRALNQSNNDEYFVIQNVLNLLQCLYNDLGGYVPKHQMIVPTKMFQNIKKELDASLPVPQNYVILRMWKLVVKVTEIMEQNDKLVENMFDDLQFRSKLEPELGAFCLEILKEDVKTYFSCIYVLFEKVLRQVLKNVLPELVTLQIYEVLLSDSEFIQANLLVLNLLSYYGRNCYYDENNENIKKELQIKDLIRNHASVEVKMHYYCKYEDECDSSPGI